jgi:uncharacterized protein (TIGR02118 family)
MLRYFLTFRAETPFAAADRAPLMAVLRSTSGMRSALVHTPSEAQDPYLHDGPPPQLMVECAFPTIEALEAAIGTQGGLAPLAAPGCLPSLAGAAVTQQAMLAREFSVPDPLFRTEPGVPYCTYQVAYEGMAEDLNLWLSHYVAHHIPLMARFPGIRGLEMFTRLDWCSALPWRRVGFMQRNKVVFDSAAALNAALQSPIRAEMRADFHRFPPFTGETTHYPMTTLNVIL